MLFVNSTSGESSCFVAAFLLVVFFVSFLVRTIMGLEVQCYGVFICYGIFGKSVF